jgi:DNA modification methylase
VEATDRRFTQVKIYQTIIRALEKKLGLEQLILPAKKDHRTQEPGSVMDEELPGNEQSSMEQNNASVSPGGN